MKIVITNVIVQNGGDAAIMLGMIEALKLIWNDCSISVFTESPEFCHKYYPHLQTGKTYGQLAVTTKLSGIRFFGRRYLYLRRKWYLICSWLFSKGVPAFLLLLDHRAKEALKEYRSADIIISCGGTYLVESYGIHAQYIDYKTAFMLKKNLYLYTQSIGEFSNPENIQMLSEVFSQCKGICLRDQQSLNTVCHIANTVHDQCGVFADAAYSLYAAKECNDQISNESGTSLDVVISVRNWEHAKSPDSSAKYRKAIAAVISKLLKQKHKVTILSTCQGNPEYTDDNAEADCILGLLDEAERSEVIRSYQIMTPYEIIERLKAADFLVATRLHMAILGTIAEIPILPIAYEFKTESLFKDTFGYANVLTWENLETKVILDELEKMLNNRAIYQKMIQQKLQDLKQGSVAAARFIQETQNNLH